MSVEISQDVSNELNRIYRTIDFMANVEGQDNTLIIEMSQAMLNDFINEGELKPIVDYVKRYCDVLDNAEDAISIAEDIEA